MPTSYAMATWEGKAPKRSMLMRILMQIRGKDCVALEVRYHKVCYGNYTKFLTRELKANKPSASVYEKSYDVFFVRKLSGRK